MKKLSRILLLFCIGLFSTTPIYALCSAQAEINKKIVINFYNKALNEKDFNAAEKYLGSYYKQHNPAVADGKAGFKTFIEFLKKNYPKSQSKIIRAIAEGNYVVLQVHSMRTPNTKSRAIFDLFRLENGKIVEHWDAIQDVPEKSANRNGMF